MRAHTHTHTHTHEVLLSCECMTLLLTVADSDTDKVILWNVAVQKQFCRSFVQMGCKCVRRTDFIASAKQPNWSKRQFFSGIPGWSHRCRAAGMFVFLLRTVPTLQRYLFNPSILSGTCNLCWYFFPRMSIYVKTAASKYVFLIIFFMSLRRLIKCYKIIKWERLQPVFRSESEWVLSCVRGVSDDSVSSLINV